MSEKKDKVTEKDNKIQEEKKKKSNKTIWTVLLIVFLILFMCGLGIFLLIRNFVVDRVEDAQQIVKEVEETYTQTETESDPYVYTEEEELVDTSYPTVNEETLDANLVNDKFPEDIPLPGGKVSESSFDQWSTEVNILTSSSAEEVFEWYENTLEESDWEITSKRRDDLSASIQFNNGLDRYEDEEYRSGSIWTQEWWDGSTIVTIKESF